MGYESPQYIGLLEKAGQLAMKYNVIYSPTLKGFFGSSQVQVDKAEAALKEWREKEASRQFRTESGE